MTPPKTVFLFLLVLVHCSHILAAGSVTNEDIRDAILQVVKVVRSSEDKLERHEYRERILGELLKKGMLTIDKRIKTFEPIRGTLNRFDERLAAVETILLQSDERERIQLQKTYDITSDLHSNLPALLEKMKEEIIDRLVRGFAPPAQITEPGVSKKDFDKMEKNLLSRVEKVGNSINEIEKEIVKIRDESNSIRNLNNQSSENLEKVKRQLNTSEQLLEKYEHKLAEYNNKIPEAVPNPDDFKEQNEMQKTFLLALDNQKIQLQQIVSDLKSMSNKLNNIPNRSDAEKINNETLKQMAILQDTMQHEQENLGAFKKALYNLDDKTNHSLQELSKNVINGDKDIKQYIKDLSDVTESMTENIGKNYEALMKEIEKVSKIEDIILLTSDNVMDTKRRVEYGVHQVLAELAQQIDESTKNINRALDDRFTNFEVSILDEEQGALANLTSKIGSEIDQVWRQIGIMHQQMSASTDTLNKLQNQTDTYVTNSINVMDNMKGKMSRITGSMSDVDDNLNYLLKRLSIVTQEFNMIKVGLGKALDDIKDSFQSVQDKINNNKTQAGPKIYTVQ